MWFIAKNKKIPIKDVVLTDSLASYHNVITFTTVAKLYADEGVIETDSKRFDVFVISQIRSSDNTTMQVDCVTKSVRDAFGSITAGFTGYTTVEKLFAKLGFKYQSDYQTNNTYFSIPQCSVTTLFDNITKYASFGNGGGAHFYMAYDGTVHGFDYKLIKEKATPYSINGSIVGEQIRTDWSDYTPSEYEFFVWGADNTFKRETLTLMKNYGKTTVKINDTTGVWKNAMKQELTNIFYNKWYSGHSITFNTVLGMIPKLGSLVTINDQTDETFIVKGVSVAYKELQDVPSTTVVLVSNPSI